MKKEIRDNQAIYENPLNFDQVYTALGPTSEDRNPIDPAYGCNVLLPSMAPARGEYEAVHAARTLDDGSVEITFYAPDAHRVEIAGIGGSMKGRYDLEKTGSGYWKTKLSDVGSGFHYCVFIVDGVFTYNPTMPFGFGNHYVLNYFEVPGEEDYYLLKDVPHGSVRMEIMRSPSCGRYRNLYVYTPYGYDTSNRRYPVLHILHGGGENEIGWFWQGKLNYIADNLIAEGKCEEMIIVASSFSAPHEVRDNVFVNESFISVMADEIVPFIDERFRTIADRDHRAIAGLSAGGSMARQIGHSRTEVFKNLGQFSCGGGFAVRGRTVTEGFQGYGAKGAVNPMDKVYSDLFSSPEEYNAKMGVTFITCGTQDPRHEYTSKQVEELSSQGFNVEYGCCPGYHEWDVWRWSAKEFMQRLFR